MVNYCASDSIATLNASEGYISYKWVDSKGTELGTSKTLNKKNPADSAIYTCTMLSASGIIGILHIMIIKYDLKVDFSFQNSCNSNTVKFINLSTKTNGNLTYKWNFGNGNTSSDANPQFTFNTSGSHIVLLEVSNPPSICSSLITHTVESFSPLSIGINGDSTFCPGYSTTLKGYGAFKYKWSTGETTDSIKISSPGRIWVIGYSGTGCISDTIFKTITKEPDWKLTIDGNTLICNNDSILLTATGGISYLWNTGATTPTITVSSSGIYNVTGINDRGCQQTSENITVFKDQSPQMDFTVSNTTVDSRNNEITCTIPELTDVLYSWEMGDGLTENGSTIKHMYNISTSIPEYKITLTATTKNGCIYTKIKNIDIIPFIPNVFTPNLDGVNDTFMADYDLQILDRYGVSIYKGNKGWNGTYNGRPADPDTYFYLLYYYDKNHVQKSKKGYITLIR
jgi:gliding motility-associated-like protein